MVHAHRPADERGLGARVGPRRPADQFGRQPGDLRHALGRVVAHRLAQRLEAGRVRGDVLAIDEVVLDDEVNQAVDEREIGARPERQVQIRHHRRLRHARIDDDERRRGFDRSRQHRIGWFSAMLAPMSRITSARSRSS